MSGAEPARLAVLVSGGGRSLENLCERIAAGALDARVQLVVSSNPKAQAIERARRLGLDCVVLPHADFTDPLQMSAAIFREVEARGCELVVLAGWLRLLVVPDAWLGRVLNIHPALLPRFGGKGFYGERVHAAVLASGAERSGCTVHYATNEYDAGPVVLQREVPVEPGDTPQTLAARVFEAEKLALPEAIRLHLRGEVRYQDGRVLRPR